MSGITIAIIVAFITLVPIIYSSRIEQASWRTLTKTIQGERIYKIPKFFYAIMTLGIIMGVSFWMVPLMFPSRSLGDFLFFGIPGTIFFVIFFAGVRSFRRAYIRIGDTVLSYRYGRQQNEISLSELANVYTNMWFFVFVLKSGERKVLPMYFEHPSEIMVVLRQRLQSSVLGEQSP